MTNELDFFSYITVIYLLEFRILVGPLLLELRVKFRFSALSGFFWERRRGIKWELTTLQREIFLGFSVHEIKNSITFFYFTFLRAIILLYSNLGVDCH